MTSNAFTSLANSRLHAPGRMVWNSCCPDKDLVVIFSRLGGSDRMALWSSSRGSRIWETDVSNGNGSSQVNAIAWSPDGQSIAVIREPPGISLHSLQDGRSLISLPLITPTGEPNTPFHVTGAWWFRDEKKEPKIANIPDIFKRNQIITGSAHSILKMLPLLDSLQEEPDKSTATDLFAFQGSHTRSSHKSQLPSIIENWPTLPADHMAASIESSSHSKQATDTAKLDEVATSNLDSILLVSDNLGRLFCYLDGAFPMGYISLGSEVDFISIVKHPQKPLFTGTPRSVQGKTGYVHLSPAVINIPLLSQRKCRDLANQSTTARELLWYTMRTIKELRETWCGSESITGAREYGMKWVQGLASKQKEQFGQSEPEPILDLTYLLTTGRISEPLMDFLGSGEQMSERGIHKWETSVTEALVKLRDFSEKRVAPALQRLHIVMEEVQGWGNLPEYASFELDVRELSTCLDLIGRGILLASWLGTSARRELHRFREFMAWLRYEILNLNAPRDENSYTRYDILEVNHYFMAGLETSTLDGWFMGPVPSFQLTDLGVAEYGNDQLEEVMEYARKVAADTSEMAWQKYDPPKDLSGVDRNIEALIQELGIQCERLFHHASQAASRSAVVSFDPKSKPERVPEKEPSPEHPLGFPFRERTILNESGEVNQHLISHQIPSLDKNTMLLCQLRFGVEASEFPSSIGGVLLQCYLPEEGDEESNLDLLDADFFDDECVVIIYRLRGGEKQAFIATLNYSDIGYQNLLHDGYVKGSSREDLMQLAVELWKDGQLPAVMAPINRRRALTGFKTGSVSTALNGRINRRLACVLDSTGTSLESFDLEGDTEDMEVGDG